jgi:hypothetical protein
LVRFGVEVVWEMALQGVYIEGLAQVLQPTHEEIITIDEAYAELPEAHIGDATALPDKDIWPEAVA